MKKTIVTIIVLVALVISFTSLAQSPPTKMPDVLAFLSSRAALRAYAIESARQANLNIESTGMSGSWGTGSSWESPQESRAILETINAWRFAFTMENPADSVHATAEIKNTEWDTLFSAQAWQTPEPVERGYRLPELYFYFEMAELIPFKVDRSIQWGQLKYLSEDGKTIVTIDLDVRNGKVYFRSGFAGRAILVLRGSTWGDTFLYDLRNGGVQIPVAHVQYNGSRSWIDSLIPFNSPDIVNYKVWSHNGVGQNPTFEVVMNSSKWVSVRTFSNEETEAIGFQVRDQGGTNWTFYPVLPSPPKYAVIPLERGVSYIVPVWNPDEFREPDPAFPVPTSPTVSGGGGKG